MPVASLAESANLESLAKLSLEELTEIKVTSVSKHAEKLFDASAAVYVITRDDIRRSGVTTVPEALRLAPGVEVARNGSHSWSISIRGFNSDLSNKLLVLIDGRSVYSPLYAGVFWDAQDTMLEDVDRIEVISGPGGTLWGANAVNGVINIITRSAKDTQGGFTEIGGGKEERGFGGFRYGGHIGQNTAARAYIKYFSRGPSRLSSDEDAIDDWHMAQSGFRMDSEPSDSDHLTFQGDIYSGRETGQFRGSFTLGTLPGSSFEDYSDVSGANLLGRWTRLLSDDADFQLQIYYDHTRRDIPGTYNETRDTLDIDSQHHFRLGDRNDILWGAGFRLTSDNLDNTLFATFNPPSRTDRTFSAFAQDKLDLRDNRLFLTLGSKFEHNDYTGFEVQPNARLSWLATERQTLWAAVSRAVRIPSRLDADLQLTAPISIPGIPFPVYVNVDGNHDFDSEKLLAYETGYRIQARDNLSFDLATFYNKYDDLQTSEPATPVVVAVPPLPYIILPNSLSNGMEGKSYGGTLATDWRPVSDWRLQFQYAYFKLQLQNKPGSVDSNAKNIERNSPKHQISLHSFLDLPHDLSLYTGVRFVDKLPNLNIHRYADLDVSVSWKTSKSLDMSITGQNLTDAAHPEFGGNEIERSIYGKLTWRF